VIDVATSDTHLRRPLKIGLHIDISEYPEDYMLGHAARQRPPDRWMDIAAMARAAEAVGLDSVTIPDHLIYRLVPGKPEGAWECFSVLAALAAITERVEIGTIVASTQFRNPALLAKLADTIDEISGGRLILGLGAGWNEVELEAFGYPADHPVGRFEEALRIIHGLLRHGSLDFDGAYYSVRDCELRPRGPGGRPPGSGPPIMIGTLGTGPRMLRLTVEYADLWNGLFDARETDRFTSYAQMHERIDRACERAERDPASLARTFTDTISPQNDPAYRQTARGPALTGSPDEIAEAVMRYAAAGVDHLILVPLPLSVASVEALAPVLEALDRG
jgi:alkanesulfonate monooxygenase SsuD/methylene tetrahydromethanopterin reductase-like flavin-dependent oxidoreductase (luciferase family)